MADRTPTRGVRTSRLQSKPYERPDSQGNSAASSRNGTPARQNRGFLSSVADMLFSPFGSKTALRRDPEATNSEDQTSREDLGRQQVSYYEEKEKRQLDMDLDDEAESSMSANSNGPIKPIRDALASFEPIDPLQSIHLINDFNQAKKALGQNQTRDERRAIEELIRRADTDSPMKSHGTVLRGVASSATLRSPSRLSRSRAAPKQSGLSKSSSMNFAALQREDAKPSTPLRKAWKADADEEPSPPGRFSAKPKHPEGLPKETIPPVPPLPSSPLPSGLPGIRSSTSRYSLTRPSGASRFSAQRNSGLSKSQSMFSLPKASTSALDFPMGEEEETSPEKQNVEPGARQRVNALVGPSKPATTASASHAVTKNESKAPQQKTAAARELEDMLREADEEEGRKSEPVAPVINPYEHYRFNVGAGSPRKRTTATEKRAGGLAGRRAILAAAEKKAKQKAKDTEMTDFDLIKENMGDAAGKRRRVEASQSHEIEVVETLPAKKSETLKSQSTAESAPTDTSSSIAVPTRSHFSFGIPEQTRIDNVAPAMAPKLVSTSSFSKPSSMAPSPYERKNDALDIVMATAGASTSPSAKLTPAIFSIAPSQDVPAPAQDIRTKEQEKDKLQKPAREEALAIESGALPVFVFKCLANVPSLATGISFAAQQKARSVASSDLPKFDLEGFSSKTAQPKAGLPASTSAAATAVTQPASVAAQTTPSKGFTGWGGIAKPSSSSATWTCNECFLQSKASSTECDVCEAPRPGSVPPETTKTAPAPPVVAPTISGFTGWGANFGAAPAATSGTDQDWTCSLCGCKSKATSQQCDVCETKRG